MTTKYGVFSIKTQICGESPQMYGSAMAVDQCIPMGYGPKKADGLDRLWYQEAGDINTLPLFRTVGRSIVKTGGMTRLSNFDPDRRVLMGEDLLCNSQHLQLTRRFNAAGHSKRN